MGLRMDSFKIWLRSVLDDGHVLQRSGVGIVSVAPTSLTTRQTIPFSVTNVAAGSDASPPLSTPVQAQWAGAAGVAVGWVAPRAGSLTGLSAALSGAAAGSNAIVGVYKNGTIMNAAAIVTLASATSDTKAHGTFTPGTYTFAAGDVIDVRIRTGSGWSATSVDLGVAVEIAD
jgi:hypothetical protein